MWVVDQVNENSGVTERLPGQAITEKRGFGNAFDMYADWLEASWGWRGNAPRDTNVDDRGDINGPYPGTIFKTYQHTKEPGAYFIEARWDYRDAQGVDTTNSVRWYVIEV